MLLLKLKHNNGIPLYNQITDQIKEMIERDVIKPGYKLPSTRTLADRLGVNRSTVYEAYQELWALGYIESRPGSYSFVRKRQELATGNTRKTKSIIPWNKQVSPASENIYRTLHLIRSEYTAESVPPNVINLSPLTMDKRLLPVEDFRKCMNKVLRESGTKVLDYGESNGYGKLRTYIANRLQLHSISVTADEVLITNGSQQGIDLILRLLTEPGSKIAVESPTYSLIIPLLKYFKLDVVSIPMLADGLDIDYLEKVLRKEKISLIYTIPNFQNPTGVTTDQVHRERLLGICEKHRVPIVEDGFEEEMKYFGNAVLPIKSMDKGGVVIYIGTFSKVLSPGIRIGWIAADKDCIERLAAIKRYSDLTSNAVVQGAIYEYCSRGYYDLHIKRMHRIFARRMKTAIKALRKYMPAGKVSWVEPAGGYLIWLKLENHKLDTLKLNKAGLRNGVLVSPGPYFFTGNKRGHEYFRICISTLNEEEIERGIRNLVKTIIQLEKS
jgi:DNA-binding transcriptional MocR family regulator